MDNQDLIEAINKLQKLLPANSGEWTAFDSYNFYLTTKQFVRTYFGTDSEFYAGLQRKDLVNVHPHKTKIQKAWDAMEVLKSIDQYLKLNLDYKKTEKFRTRVDIISDFLKQAILLSNDKKYHPAASAILAGAALEEFLKKLASKNEIEFDQEKATINPIALKLREAEIINKQDVKDITSWAGLRNDASHGKFEEVDDRKRIKNAIEGINLFMRKYS